MFYNNKLKIIVSPQKHYLFNGTHHKYFLLILNLSKKFTLFDLCINKCKMLSHDCISLKFEIKKPDKAQGVEVFHLDRIL